MIKTPSKIKKASAEEKYGKLKSLLITAKENPRLLYSEFDHWMEMLNDPNNFVKWTAIDIVGHLSSVDIKNKINDEVIQTLNDLLKGGKLITANHAIYSFTLIAKNKPVYRKQIIQALLNVSKYKYETEECKNIVTGKVILALAELRADIMENKQALSFIKKACSNTRNATKKKAEALLKKLPAQ